jgi:hypothetical protein
MAELRQRTAATMLESAALCETSQWVCAESSATCEVVRISRLQWRTWRAGLEVLQRRSEALGVPRLLRVCPGCESVCFAPEPGHGAVEVEDAAESWVQPPRGVRDTLHAAIARLVVVRAACPRCRADALQSAAEDTPVRAASAPVWPHDAANVLLSVLSDVADTAARIAESSPWLDDEEALEQALTEIVERLRQTVSPDELREIADTLCSVVRELRQVPRSPSLHSASTPAASVGVRFRPPLRSN